jgi:DNA-binding beta-propeller fold protein YncE
VAYEVVHCSNIDCQGAQVRVLNTRTGQLTRSAPALPDYQGLQGLVVNPSGNAAYIRLYQRDTGLESQVVEMVGGKETVIASGTGIARFSLALVGETLYWTQDGQARSATLPD